MTGYLQRLVDRAMGEAPHVVRPRARSRFEPQPLGPAEVPAPAGLTLLPPSEEDLRPGAPPAGAPARAGGGSGAREEADPAPASAVESPGRAAPSPGERPPDEPEPSERPPDESEPAASPHGAAAAPAAPAARGGATAAGRARAARPTPAAPPPPAGTSAPHRTDTGAAPPVHGPQEHSVRPAAPDGGVLAGTGHAAAGPPARAHPRATTTAVPPAPPEPATPAEAQQEPRPAQVPPGTSPWSEDLGTPTSDDPPVTVRIGRIVVAPPPVHRDTGPRRSAVTLPPLAEYLREGRPQ